MDRRSELKVLLTPGFSAVLGRPPSTKELATFSGYLDLLLRWNRIYSLTAYRKPADITQNLFLDSLLFLGLLPPQGRVLDLGAGIGIPGIPIKIVEPNREVTLIEARRRRAVFLSTAVRELGLAGAHVLHGRAETLLEERQGLRGDFEAVVSRAAGKPGRIVPLALEFLKTGGRVIVSGPPAGTPAGPPPHGELRVLISPGTGRPRRFFVVEKAV